MKPTHTQSSSTSESPPEAFLEAAFRPDDNNEEPPLSLRHLHRLLHCHRRRPHSDGLSLLAFKSTVSDPLSTLFDWDSSSDDPFHWSNVSCSNLSASLCVVSLSLSSKNLSGYLPSKIAGLFFLRRLNEEGRCWRWWIRGCLGR
ncbi:Tyrosine-sulfated glycopeptide receptor 1 [Acorus calamus]|uniref:Tyrosine-sulfated glycopeptide receptor 1 n=1 Tax=Acorus calamus TaxID=4465 RepID=A0AAV9EII7_ACOCL|nr:Tyrosine-sulfated glycopeptide receptor 1 [Acorus calamus]KAK1312645.1 Tyrosine-sulfated glycopeptide receptor 1 [Acorus calamus]